MEWGSQGVLDHLEAAAGNLLGQMGALSAEQTRKATILQGGQLHTRALCVLC